MGAGQADDDEEDDYEEGDQAQEDPTCTCARPYCTDTHALMHTHAPSACTHMHTHTPTLSD